MKDKSFEELKEEGAKQHSSVYLNEDFRIRSHVGFECGWDACSKLFLEKHPVVLGLAEAYKELLDNLAHYASPRRDEYHPVKHEWKEVSE